MKKRRGMVYRGYAAGRRVTVTSDRLGELTLDPGKSQRVRNHSPDGWDWGSGNPGSSQLALAILLDYYGDVGFASAHYQTFKWSAVSKWPQDDDWEITGVEIEEALR